MKKINDITNKYENLPWMNEDQALYIRKIIQQYKCKNLCELGHLHGKSSIYIGAILEEQGFGKLTTFDSCYNDSSPNIQSLIKEFGLENFIEPVLSFEGYHWDLAKHINEKKSKFDFCYFDGCHTFNSTGLAFTLVDLLLDKGGIVIFDDYIWTIEDHPAVLDIIGYQYSTAEQIKTSQVKMVCDVIVQNYNYSLIEIVDDLNWAIYQKN